MANNFPNDDSTGTHNANGNYELESGNNQGRERSTSNALMARKDKENDPKLCETCLSLELSVDRFIVGLPGLTSRTSVSPNNVYRLRSSTKFARLGTLREIHAKGKRGCSLCSLIAKSTKCAPESASAATGSFEDLSSAVCHINWEIDGRRAVVAIHGLNSARLEDTVRGLTRRIHLTWSHPELTDTHLVFVAQVGWYFMTGSDAHRSWGPESLFLGRRIQGSSNTQVRLKSWLDLCREHHPGPCRSLSASTDERFRDLLSHSYFGVIDVLNMQLTELPTHPATELPRPYAALSYVWGNRPSFTTTLENVNLLRLHGGIGQVLSSLPPVIRDTIDLVRSLGLQYLWIDALCIVQDSKKSWKLNAFNMDSIYGGAELTICAADGDDAFTGLCAMRREDDISHQDIADCGNGVHLMVSRPPESYVRASKWNSRAWTFQERLLSRRCLIFVNGRVYFQCRSTGMSEDLYADREGAGWSLDLVDAPMQMFRQLSQRSFWVYAKVVSLYSTRNLTKSKDILAAFSGITNVMEECMHAPFIFGLPSSHFDLALLWQHNSSVNRRKPKTKAEVIDYAGLEFPSWSWMGWLGTPTAYRQDALGDTLENPSEWLERHTWIRWYIRDGKGDLRPLWDPKRWQTDGSEDARWRGYSTIRTSAGAIFQHYSKRVSELNRHPEVGIPPPPPAWAAAVPPPLSARGHQTYMRNKPYVENPNSSGSFTSTSDDWESESNNGTVQRPLRSTKQDHLKVSVLQDKNAARLVGDQQSIETSSADLLSTRAAFSQDLRAMLRLCIYPIIVLLRLVGFGVFADEILRLTHMNNLLLAARHWLIRALEPTQSKQAHSHSIPGTMRKKTFQNGRLTNVYEPEKALGITATFKPQKMSRWGPHPTPVQLTPPPPPPLLPRRPPPLSQQLLPVPALGQPAFRASQPAHYQAKQALTAQQPNRRAAYDKIFKPDKDPLPAQTESTPRFFIYPKECPYRPVIAEYSQQPNSPEFPLMPILQFYTYHTWLYIQPENPKQPGLANGTTDAKPGLIRFHVADGSGDWCGSIMLDSKHWNESDTHQKQEFIAISEAKKFSMTECESWNYYIPKERDQSEWDLFYVLLIVRKDEQWERVGLGKVFKEAFMRTAKWKEIMLG